MGILTLVIQYSELTMMEFIFPPHIQQGILSGAYEIVRNNTTGQLIGLARNKVTGQFVGHAVQIISHNTLINSLLPISIPLKVGLAIFGMYQDNKNFQDIEKAFDEIKSSLGILQTTTEQGFKATLEGINAIQLSLGVLQATTAVIGVGVAATAVLSGVNLWQTLKLREDVKQLRLQVTDGFIDLKEALRTQGVEIIEAVNFQSHRLELVKAYGRFLEATKLIKIALSCEDKTIRNADLANARQTLSEALAIYNNPHLLSETSAVGKLRRFECAWMIEMAIAYTYQVQNETKAVSDRLFHLKDTINQDCLKVITACDPKQEIDFLFPEILHIRQNDLIALDCWQNQADWIGSLSSSELKSLAGMEINQNEEIETPEVDQPVALSQYEILKQTSHPDSLRDQLKLMFSPQLRPQYESEISEKAQVKGYNAIANSNLKEASDLTLANLYWYFKELV